MPDQMPQSPDYRPTQPTIWIVTVYDEKGVVLDSWKISDRTEHEAFDEAAADVPRVKNFFDWSLMPKNYDSQNDRRINH